MRRVKFWLCSLDKANLTKRRVSLISEVYIHFSELTLQVDVRDVSRWIENDSKTTSLKNEKKISRKIMHFPFAQSRNRWNTDFYFELYVDGAAPYEFAHSTDASSSTKMQKSYLADNAERRQAVSTSRYMRRASILSNESILFPLIRPPSYSLSRSHILRL